MKNILMAAAVMLAASGTAFAGAMATGEQIGAAISGNTVKFENVEQPI